MAGWLDKTEGVAWNTASALRPSLTIPSGNNNDYLCLWDSEEAAINKNNCNGKTPLGKIWFKFDQRLAIINETEKAWKVVLRGNNCTEDMDKCEENLLNGPNTNMVENIKNIDVMFVVDGTKSIAPVIQSIKGTEEKPGLIQQIRERLSSKLSQNINLRVGFRIYRDSQKGGKNDGVRKEENLSLRSASCDGTKTFRKFDKEFKKVKPGDRFKDTDLEENFFGGILEGIRDLRSCKSHIKLLFVVGDHGYSCEAQKSKGFKRCVTTEKIVNEMFKNSKIPISPFFVQLPIEKDPQKITNQGRLDKAYSTYERQSKDILSFYAKKLFELSPNKKISEKEFTEEGLKRFLRLPRSDLSKLAAGELVQVLDSYVNPEFIFGAINRGRTGENWVDAFNTERERTNAPVLLAEAILAGICGENETNDQCEDDIIQKVSQVWVSKDDNEKVTREILMTTEQLNDWKNYKHIRSCRNRYRW